MINLLLAIQQMRNTQHMTDGWGSGYGMVFMIIFWLLIISLVITLIWFLIRKGRESSASPGLKSSPLEILKNRYARGEIDEDEYRRMKKEISD